MGRRKLRGADDGAAFVKVTASTSPGRFHGNKKRPSAARQRRVEGLTTRRHDLPMAVTHPMYPCPLTHGSLLHREGRADG
jgi:hypothetical protein